jgi:hypothetical protein
MPPSSGSPCGRGKLRRGTAWFLPPAGGTLRLYVAADESGLTEALLQRVRALTAKYRVLSGAGWLREHSGGELPKLALSDGERRLMQRLKAALDERGILPTLF